MAAIVAFAIAPCEADQSMSVMEYLSRSEVTASTLSPEQTERLDAILRDDLASEITISKVSPDDLLRDMQGLAEPRQRIERQSKGSYSIYSHDEETGDEVSLVIMGKDVLGKMREDGQVYRVHPLGDGVTATYRYDTSQLRRHPEGYEDFIRESLEQTKPMQPAPTSGTDSGAVIDLMVAYTWLAGASAGNIDALIQLNVNETNRAYINSGIRTQIRLVHSYMTDYGQTDIETDLDRLRKMGDGYLDEVHALRDQYAADLVMLITAFDLSTCGLAYLGLSGPRPDIAFSVVTSLCAAVVDTFPHELGHNQGAAHNPGHARASAYPYGHGFCNVAYGWHTVMSYDDDGADRSCRREVPHFSSPTARYGGIPTGDTHTRNNARVLNETALLVANFRHAQQTSSYMLPLMPSADNESIQGFVRIHNYSDRAGEIEIIAIDDTGQRFGPATLEIGALHNHHFNSNDLEHGSASKRLTGGVGDGSGHWRLELSSDLSFVARAYIRTPDGFLTSMRLLASVFTSNPRRSKVYIFNPYRTTTPQSVLRVINPNFTRVNVTVQGWDDEGTPGDSPVRFSLGAGEAVQISSQDIEQGSPDFTGRFDDGEGKWEIEVIGTEPLQVMSLLMTRTGHLTNVSQ